jgi:hypothetical protein
MGLVKTPIFFGTLCIIIWNNRTKERLLEYRSFVATVIVMLFISITEVIGVVAYYYPIFSIETVKGDFFNDIFYYIWKLTPLPTLLFAKHYF